MTPVEMLLGKLPGATKSGSGWSARCPAHDDRKASLSVGEGDDGRALVKCHAGCALKAIVAALGLTVRDLMPPGKGPTPKVKFGGTNKSDAPKSGGKVFPTASAAVAWLEAKHGPRSGLWTYHDAAGEPVGVVVRWDTGDGKDIRPVARFPDGWRVGAMPAPRPLYRLPELASAVRVLVVEGEKAADAARSLGFVATTSAGGAEAAGRTDWTPLAGKEVWLLPDNDAPGRKYAGTAEKFLKAMKPSAAVRTVVLPGLPEKGDIVDWIAARGDAAPDALRAEIEALAASPPPGPRPVLTCMADVEPEEVAWLWPDRIPIGRLTILVGRPGEGKSFLTTALAAHVTTGRDFPDRTPCPAGSVIMLSAEDAPADTIRPRLDAAGADVKRVFLLSGVMSSDPGTDPTERMITLADVAVLEAALRAHPDCRLVVVDPIGSYLGGETDAHRDNEVRAVLRPIADLAARYGVAVVLVAHRRKSSGDFADDGVLGSRAFTGIARAVWHVSRDPEDKDRRLMLPGKNNLSHEGDGLAFRIEGRPGRVVWEAEPVRMSADDAQHAEARTAAEKRKPGPDPTAREKATEWLREQLVNGPRLVSELKEVAVKTSHKWRTVERAAGTLNVVSDKLGFGGATRWSLPVATNPENPSCQDTQAAENVASWRECKNAGENANPAAPPSNPATSPDVGGDVNYFSNGTLFPDDPQLPD